MIDRNMKNSRKLKDQQPYEDGKIINDLWDSKEADQGGQDSSALEENDENRDKTRKPSVRNTGRI